MSKTPWTPGPWKLTEQAETWVTNGGGALITKIVSVGSNTGGSKMGNARLIAAAPEMAELLAGLAEFCGKAATSFHLKGCPNMTKAAHERESETRALLARIGAP